MLKDVDLAQLSLLFEHGMKQALIILRSMSKHELALVGIQCVDASPLLAEHRLQDSTSVHIDMRGDIEGKAVIFFSPSSAAAWVAGLSEAEHMPIATDALRAGALTEIANIIHNALIHALVQYYQVDVSCSLPCCMEGEDNVLVAYAEASGNQVLAADCTLALDGLQVGLQFVLAMRCDANACSAEDGPDMAIKEYGLV